MLILIKATNAPLKGLHRLLNLFLTAASRVLKMKIRTSYHLLEITQWLPVERRIKSVPSTMAWQPCVV
jgi:hypothetical protein